MEATILTKYKIYKGAYSIMFSTRVSDSVGYVSTCSEVGQDGGKWWVCEKASGHLKGKVKSFTLLRDAIANIEGAHNKKLEIYLQC